LLKIVQVVCLFVLSVGSYKWNVLLSTRLCQYQHCLGITYNWRMLSTWFNGEIKCFKSGLTLLRYMSDLFFVVVFLCSSRIKIISPCCCCFHSSPNNMHCMFWWALACISCCWLCKRISQPSSSHNIIWHCSFKSSSCCEFHWIFMG